MNGTVLALCGVGIGVAAIVFDVVAYRLHRRALCRHFARFPMFAIRDELVALVASGQMHENDPAWQHIYRSVNRLLDMHRRLDVVDVAMSFARYHLAKRTDSGLLAASERVDAEVADEAGRVPAFKRVLDQLDVAFFALVLERSWPLPSFRLKFATWRFILRLRLRLLFHQSGVWRVAPAISKQGGRQLAGWQEWSESKQAA